MDEDKRNLEGSKSRDRFKRLHKDLNRRFYGCDLDFIIVEKYPFRIAAFLDYKHQRESVTFSEVVAYNSLIQIAPVFIVKSRNVDVGPFWIYEYKGGDPMPDPPIYQLIPSKQCDTWADLESWEYEIRNNEVNNVLPTSKS